MWKRMMDTKTTANRRDLKAGRSLLHVSRALQHDNCPQWTGCLEKWCSCSYWVFKKERVVEGSLVIRPFQYLKTL